MHCRYLWYTMAHIFKCILGLDPLHTQPVTSFSRPLSVLATLSPSFAQAVLSFSPCHLDIIYYL